jgi:large subunit ribosomal protein L35
VVEPCRDHPAPSRGREDAEEQDALRCQQALPRDRFGQDPREKAGKRHNLEKKASKVTRRMTGTVEVAKADTARAKKLLGL